jgi:hypothetical protein
VIVPFHPYFIFLGSDLADRIRIRPVEKFGFGCGFLLNLATCSKFGKFFRKQFFTGTTGMGLKKKVIIFF